MARLDDIFELIEDLPEDLKDTLTTVRELDLLVQNALDTKTKESDKFFRNAKGMQQAKRESVFEALKLNFKKILDDADEKVNVIERLESHLMYRLQQLDRQIAELKIDLEADSPGVTTAIEDRVAQSDDRAKSKKQKEEQTKRPEQISRKISSASSTTSLRIDEVPANEPLSPAVADLPEKAVNGTAVSLDVETTVLAGVDLTRYCICNEVSYGEMIACDNQSCPQQWFHYACVKITAAPEGFWFCPSCRPKECTVSLNKC